MFEFASSPRSIALAINFIFAVCVFFYGLMKKSERQNIAFANLSIFLILFWDFADYVWYWFISYPVVFIVLFVFSKKFMDFSGRENNIGNFTIKEFFSLLKLKRHGCDERHTNRNIPDKNDKS